MRTDIGAGGQPIAFVRDELLLDEGVCILRSAYGLRICYELGLATFTHTKHRNIAFSFHDSKLALRHASSSLLADPIGSYFPTWRSEKATVESPPRAKWLRVSFTLLVRCALERSS